ncbi:MAG: hypothetical protein ACOH2N_12310 [Devosia sp.]
MALTPAEKQKAYRKRQKDARKKAPDQSTAFIKLPFHEYVARHGLGMEENLDAAGIHISGSLEDAVQVFETEADWDSFDTPGIDIKTSLGRATIMVGSLLDAATELAGVINDFKLAEVDTAIENAFTASAGLRRDDVEGLKASYAEIDRLKAIQTQLRKQVRRMIPATQVKGE